jgi:anthraniloyl-CoA monooxygenase
MGDAARRRISRSARARSSRSRSAIALADYAALGADLAAAFEEYEDTRRTEVLRLQSAARNSPNGSRTCERYLDLDPIQFNYSLLTRSQRISHENLRLRDPKWLEGAEQWFQKRGGRLRGRCAPMFAPFRLRDMELQNRVVVSPMAQYKAPSTAARRLAPRAPTASAPRAAPASSIPR